MAKRVAILTGGGDCPGLNAVIRAVVKYAHGSCGWDVIGIEDGFQGLYERRFMDLGPPQVRDLLARGGTILGSSLRANPRAYPVRLPAGGEEIRDVTGECLENLAALAVEAVVVVGGDGTLSIAKHLADAGVKVVGVPKTIDNDLPGTDFTVGFHTAVEIATAAIDRIHTTAESHDRIMICEVMGRYAGWIALAAGMASGADVILIPEIEYDLGEILAAIDRRRRVGITYSIVVIAEGARSRGGEYAVVRESDTTQQALLGGAGVRLASEIRAASGCEVRVTVLGHVQRGGAPSAFDRILASRFGVAAVDLIQGGRFGRVTIVRGNQIQDVALGEVVGEIKRVPLEGNLVAVARATGVGFGDGRGTGPSHLG